MNDILVIAQAIEKKIALLEHGRSELNDRAKEKARAIADYEKSLSIAIIKERENGTPSTVCEKISRGVCHKECLRKELADALYKAAIVKIESIKAEMNGLQSIYRHLDES